MKGNKRKAEQKIQKGITLIALIITIIVMLILVGVTISVALNGELFTTTQQAVSETQKEADREQLLSAVIGAIGTDAKVEFSKLDSNLPKDWTGSNGTYTSPKGNTFKVSADGTITEGGNQSGGSGENSSEGTTLISMYRAGESCTNANCTNKEHLHVGDYVNYTPDTTRTTYYPDGEDTSNMGINTGGTETTGATSLQAIQQENLNWRVLGAKDDSVLLVSGTPTATTSGGIGFAGYVGYNNYENILNTACSTLYSKTGVGTARSITMNDIKTYLGSTFDETEYDAEGSGDGYYGYTNDNIPSLYDYDSSTNTLTKLAEGTTKTLSLASNAYAYTASDYITNPTKLNLLLGTSNNYYYWVANRSVLVNSDNARFCMSLIRKLVYRMQC